MAGTRRHPRLGDTDIHRPPDSVSQPTSGDIDQTANDEALAVPTKDAENADKRHVHAPAPSSRSTKGICRTCRGSVGEFYNSWRKVTGSYYIPALPGSYRSLLRRTGKHQAASNGTDLEKCTIQPLSCPATGCIDSPIGFTVVNAPADKRNFCGREFFKLSRIELQCEISANKIITVEPQEDPAPDLLTLEDSLSPSPEPASISSALSPDAMEVDSRPQLSSHRGHYQEQRERPQLRQLPQQTTSVQRSKSSAATTLPPPSLNAVATIASKVAPQALPSPLPVEKPISEQHQTMRASPQEGYPGARKDPLFVQSQSHDSHALHQTNGHSYPRPSREVDLDAIERLQTQISQNSGALAAHTRDIRRGEESFQQLEEKVRRDFQAQLAVQHGDIQKVDEAIARLHHEMQGMRQMMEGLSRELHLARLDGPTRTAKAQPQSSIQDSALELMAQQMAITSQKVNDIDSLRITMEIMKNKIQRLEEDSQRAETLQPAQRTQVTTPHHAHQPVLPPVSASAQLSSNAQMQHSFGTPTSTTAPETMPRPDPVASHSSGWTTVNAGAKRTHSSDMENAREGYVSAPSSPKRQKLSTTEPASNYVTPQTLAPGQAPGGHIESPERRHSVVAHTLPSQHAILEAMHASQAPPYAAYSTQDGPVDDGWYAQSQRSVEHRPRGRGRGGGPGSRGGRGRKSLPAQLHSVRTLEWDTDEWQAVRDSQLSPDGYHSQITHQGRGIARRGGFTPSDRAMSLGPQGMNMGSPGDPYAHTKKTRTKPIRNADGVLIRKDGRPDMRSQSSAANLRRVHARKEGDPSHSPTGFTPTSLQHSASADHQHTLDTPSPSPHSAGHDVTTSVHKKHNAIMGKMFPSGLDASRKRHDYAHQVFEDDPNRTIRSHDGPRPSSAEAPPRIKKEQRAQSNASHPPSPKTQDMPATEVENSPQPASPLSEARNAVPSQGHGNSDDGDGGGGSGGEAQ